MGEGDILAESAQRSCGWLISGVLKAKLDGTLSNLVLWKVSLPMAEHWNQIILKAPSKPFCDSLKFWSEILIFVLYLLLNQNESQEKN